MVLCCVVCDVCVCVCLMASYAGKPSLLPMCLAPAAAERSLQQRGPVIHTACVWVAVPGAW